jgi:hypothetical protein
MDLLGTAVAPGDVAALFERLLDMALPALEKRKFAATERPRAPRPQPSSNTRSIPAHVKRQVWRRDDGRCTFVNGKGRRCERRHGLHFDHRNPVALGGVATIENIRLLCPTHNQLEAERRLGADFMRSKRPPARGRRSEVSPAPVNRTPGASSHKNMRRARRVGTGPARVGSELPGDHPGGFASNATASSAGSGVCRAAPFGAGSPHAGTFR